MDSFALNSQIKEWVILLTFIGTIAWLGYIVATSLRRRQQMGMQKALLEKFATAHDFAEFMQSPAGQKYVTSLTDQVTSPRGAILNAVRAGFVIAFAGAGFLAGGQGSDTLSYRVGCVLFLAGGGFLASAVVSFFLAKKIGKEQE
jgi:hypothetical protein